MAAQLIGSKSAASNALTTSITLPQIIGDDAFLCLLAMTTGATTSLSLSGVSSPALYDSGINDQNGSTWSRFWILPLSGSAANSTATVTTSVASKTALAAAIINGSNLNYASNATADNTLARTIPAVTSQDAIVVLGGSRVPSPSYPTFTIPNPPYTAYEYYGSDASSGAGTTAFAASGTGGGGQAITLNTSGGASKACFLAVSYRTMGTLTNASVWTGSSESTIARPYLWDGNNEIPLSGPYIWTGSNEQPLA